MTTQQQCPQYREDLKVQTLAERLYKKLAIQAERYARPQKAESKNHSQLPAPSGRASLGRRYVRFKASASVYCKTWAALHITCCASREMMPAWRGNHPRVPADQTKTCASSFSTERISGYCNTWLAARSASQSQTDRTLSSPACRRRQTHLNTLEHGQAEGQPTRANSRNTAGQSRHCA
jgi:hypothetical protein